jgi:riboflavin synthase alpha subunit
MKRRSAPIVVLGDLNGRVESSQEDLEIVNENEENVLEAYRVGDLIIMNGCSLTRKCTR